MTPRQREKVRSPFWGIGKGSDNMLYLDVE